MVAREQALDILDRMRKNKPTRFFNKLDETSAGMNFILAFLSESNCDVYASTIADKMQISRARVAVLLQKLISKGLIEKSSSNSDARIEVIKLTSNGFDEINKFKERMISDIVKLIEEVGIEEIHKFLDTSAKIKKILDGLD